MNKDRLRRNVVINSLFHIVNITFLFFLRRTLINSVGIEVSGLHSLFNNFIGLLNLSELGITSAITYSLYKPLKNSDNKRILEVMVLFRKVYKICGFIYFLIGIIISFSLGTIIKHNLENRFVLLTFLLYMVASSFIYFFGYKSVLLVADEKSYICNMVLSIFKIIKVLLQILMLYYYKNYIIFLSIETVSNFLTFIFIDRLVTKLYSSINFNTKYKINVIFRNNKKIFNDIGNLLWHKIGTYVLFQTDNIVLSSFVNLQYVALYSNYMMILTNAYGIFTQMFISMIPSIGKQLVESKRRLYINWLFLFNFTWVVTTIIAIGFYFFISPFIALWIGQKFILNDYMVLLMALYLFISIVKQPIVIYKTAGGIFHDKIAAILEVIINLLLSVILVKFIGPKGVLIGTIVSNIIIGVFWQPFLIFKELFDIKYSKYILIVIKRLLISLIMIIVISFLSTEIGIANDTILFGDFLLSVLKFICLGLIAVLIVSLVDSNIRVFVFRKGEEKDEDLY